MTERKEENPSPQFLFGVQLRRRLSNAPSHPLLLSIARARSAGRLKEYARPALFLFTLPWIALLIAFAGASTLIFFVGEELFFLVKCGVLCRLPDWDGKPGSLVSAPATRLITPPPPANQRAPAQQLRAPARAGRWQCQWREAAGATVAPPQVNTRAHATTANTPLSNHRRGAGRRFGKEARRSVLPSLRPKAAWTPSCGSNH